MSEKRLPALAILTYNCQVQITVVKSYRAQASEWFIFSLKIGIKQISLLQWQKMAPRHLA
jgi:hypothetical protein